jgi:hypothetical protein
VPVGLLAVVTMLLAGSVSAPGATASTTSRASAGRTGSPGLDANARARADTSLEVRDRRRAGRAGRASRDGDRVTTGLEVTIEQLSPSSLVPGEPVVVSGTVTNLDPHRWKDLQAFLVVDSVPMTTREEVDALLESPADSYNGDRIGARPGDEATGGLYDDDIDPLAPGASTRYQVSVPFSQLSLAQTPGVYTVSIHVLGERVDQGRLDGADGRARTLMPYLGEEQDPTGLSVVIPLHHPLERAADGSYADLDELIGSISYGGLLRNRLDLIPAASTAQATLMVDPALVDALSDIAAGGKGPPVVGDGERSRAEEDAYSTTDQVAAREFLSRLQLAATRSNVLIEPYGQADLTAVAQRPRLSLRRTLEQVEQRALESVVLPGVPVLQPAGELVPTALDRIAERRLLLVSSDQVEGWTSGDGPRGLLRDEDGGRVPVLMADATIETGGPAPGPSDGPLHLRQRMLAEAALQSVAGDPPGLVFLPSETWNPGPGAVGADLFDQLDTAWTFTASLPSLDGPGPRTDVRVAEVRAAPPLPSYVLTAAAALRRRARIYEAVSGAQDTLLPYYEQAAALSLSSQLRSEPELAQRLARESRATIDAQLGRITVEGPEFVTLSSDAGFFPITLTNELDHPVTVGAVVSDDDGLLSVDEVDMQVLEPRTQVTLTVSVVAPSVGVTTVTVRLVTGSGQQFGDPTTFPLRSSMVGTVIWYAMGAVGVFLLLLVVRRIWRRVRDGVRPPERAP